MTTILGLSGSLREGSYDTALLRAAAELAADGLLLATPECNNSLPGVLKNAIDWLTRPPDDIGRVFGGRRTSSTAANASSTRTRASGCARSSRG